MRSSGGGVRRALTGRGWGWLSLETALAALLAAQGSSAAGCRCSAALSTAFVRSAARANAPSYALELVASALGR
eukprot:9096405-Pyramimonas_sp.AAC.1